MAESQAYNIVIVGESFPVQHLAVDEFEFHGKKPVVQVQVQQVIQAGVDEYQIRVLPDRFEVGFANKKTTGYRMGAVAQAAEYFLTEFVSMRAVVAVGHNFSGTFTSPINDAAEFMRRLSIPKSFEEALRSKVVPTSSLTTRFQLGDEDSALLRLEPLASDATKVFYDMNTSWGSVGAPIGTNAAQVVKRFDSLATDVGSLIDRLSTLKFEE